MNCVFCFSRHRWVSGIGHKQCVLFQLSLVGQWCWSKTVCSVSAIIGGSVVLIKNCVFCFSHHRWVSGVDQKLCVLFQPSSVGQWCWSKTVCSVSAIIGGSVVLLLCTILLVMFIVYRMRKKDEGSYALDEPKLMPNYSYQRAPDKEFYAWGKQEFTEGR